MKRLHLRPLAAAALALLLLASCGERRRTADALLRATAMMERQPDSALLLLEAAEARWWMPKPLRHEYALRHTQARDKTNQPLDADTAVLAAADFFVREKSNDKAALALFYSGRVRQEQQRPEEAAQAYLRAANHAALLTDKTLQGMAHYNLGSLSYDKLLTDKAIAHYKQAYLCFSRKPNDYRRQAMALSELGGSYSVAKQQDSALHYLGKALELARLHGDSTLQSAIYQSMGVAIREQERADAAHSYFLQALRLGAAAHDEAVLYHNLAESYLDLGRRDSARHYMQQLVQLNRQDTSAMGWANTYHLQSSMEEQQGSYKKALGYHKQYVEYLDKEFENLLGSSMREVEEKYKLEQVENRHNRWVITSQRIMMGLLALLLAMAFVSRRLYRRNLRLSERLLEMAALTAQVEAEREQEQQLRERQGISLEEKEKMLNALQGQHLGTIKQASLLKSWMSPDSRAKYGKEMHRFDQLIYGDRQGDDWQLLYGALNELYGGALDRLWEALSPQLNDTELRICCLSYAQFDITDTSTVLSLSGKTVLNERSLIRQKLQMPDSADFYTYLKEYPQAEI